MTVLLDAKVAIEPKTYRAARFRLYWWVLGRWLAAAAFWALVGTLAIVLSGASLTLTLISLEVVAGLVVANVVVGLVTVFRRYPAAISTGPFRFLAEEEGMTVQGPFGSQTFRWSSYRSAYRDDDFVYLMLSRRLGQVIPLRSIGDPGPLLDHLSKLGLLRPAPKGLFVV